MNNGDRDRGGFISGILKYFIMEIIVMAVQTIVQLFTWGMYISIYQKLNTRIQSSILCHILTAIIMISIMLALGIFIFYIFDINSTDLYYRRRHRYY